MTTTKRGPAWMELSSPEMLALYMRHRGLSVRELASRCEVRDAKGRIKVLSPGAVGNLRAGYRKTCSPETAGAIERALGAPYGALFTPKVLSRAA